MCDEKVSGTKKFELYNVRGCWETAGLVVRGLLRDLEVALDAIALDLDGADLKRAQDVRVQGLGGGLRDAISFGILSFQFASSSA